MALTLNSGVLGQSTPTAATLTTIYTGPTDIVAGVAITATNKGSAAVLIRIGIQKGATTTYLVYDEPLPPAGQPGNYFNFRAGLVGPGDLLRVYAASANVDFTAMGHEQPYNFKSLDV